MIKIGNNDVRPGPKFLRPTPTSTLTHYDDLLFTLPLVDLWTLKGFKQNIVSYRPNITLLKRRINTLRYFDPLFKRL